MVIDYRTLQEGDVLIVREEVFSGTEEERTFEVFKVKGKRISGKFYKKIGGLYGATLYNISFDDIERVIRYGGNKLD